MIFSDLLKLIFILSKDFAKKQRLKSEIREWSSDHIYFKKKLKILKNNKKMW